MLTLQVWDNPRAAPGAQALGALPHVAVMSGSIELGRSGPQGPSFTCTRDAADRAGIRTGAWLYVHHVIRGTYEFPILQVVRGAGVARDTVTVQCGTIRSVLANRGTVRTINRYDAPTVSFTLPTLTPAEIGTQYLWTNLADDGLTWIVPGVSEYPGTIALGAFAAWTRAQVMDAVEQATGYRYVFTRLADGRYRCDLRNPATFSTVDVALDEGVAVYSLEETQDLTSAANVIEPRTSAGLPMRDTWWEVAAITGAGPWWVRLVDPADPENGPPVIREDGQFVGQFLRPNDGLAIAIAASRASDSSVQVAVRTGLVVGGLAGFVRTAEGALSSEVSSPSGLTAAGGRVVKPITVPVTNTRANRLVDPVMRRVLGGWEKFGAAFGGVDLVVRTDPVTLALRINGAVGAGAASIGVDSAPGENADALVRFGDPLLVEGLSTAANANVTTDAAGKATVPLTAALPAAIASDVALAWKRAGVDVGTALTDGVQAALAGSLTLKGLSATPQLTAADTLTLTGSTTVQLGDDFTNYGVGSIPGGTAFDWIEVRTYTLPLIPVPIPRLYRWSGATIGATAAGAVASVDQTARPAFLAGETLQSLIGFGSVAFTAATITLSGAQPAWSGTLTATAVASVAQTLTAGTLLAWARAGVGLGTVRVTANVAASVNIPLELTAGFTRVETGDTFELPAQTLYASADVQIDSAGAGTIPLRVVTAAAIADNTVVRLQRARDLAPAAFGGPNVVRLRGNWATFPTAGDYRSTTRFALYSPIMRVESPDPSKVSGAYVALIELGLTRWAAEAGQGQRGWVALWDADTGAQLGLAGFGNVTPAYTPLFNVSTHSTVSFGFVPLGTVPRRIRLSLHPGGGDVGDGPGGFTFLRYAALTITTALSADIAIGAALVDGAFSNQMHHRAQDALAASQDSARYVLQVSAASVDPALAQIEPEARVRLSAPSLNRHRALRVARVVLSMTNPDDLQLELATSTPRLTEA